MTIKNSVSHRADYAKQKRAGQIADPTIGRHGRGPTYAPQPVVRPRPRPTTAPDGMTLAERLGIELPPPVEAPVRPQPLPDMLPPANANVPDAPAPRVEVDPLLGEGELPPVADLKQAAPLFKPAELPSMTKSWVDDGMKDQPLAKIDAEETQETDEDPLI